VDPECITGISGRSASFSIIVYRRNKGKWEIRPIFELLVNDKYKQTINYMLLFFNWGSTYKLINNNIIYRVIKIVDLNEVIIPHFNKYPLLSSKKTTYILWVECIKLMNLGLYKSKKGLKLILLIYTSIGGGASNKVIIYFPDLIPVPKVVKIELLIELSEYWISGYFSIYYYFNVDINPYGLKESYYNRVVTSFNFSLTINEFILMEKLASYFDTVPHIRSDDSKMDINVYGLGK
jgi:LAGLIDADG endonuclease